MTHPTNAPVTKPYFIDLHSHLSGSIPKHTFEKLLVKYLKRKNPILIRHKKWLIEYFSIQDFENNHLHSNKKNSRSNSPVGDTSTEQLSCSYEENRNLPTLEQCFILFACIHEIIQEREDFQLLIRDVLEEYLNECMYIELRTTPRILSDVPNGLRGYVELLIEEVNRFFEEKEPSLQQNNQQMSNEETNENRENHNISNKKYNEINNEKTKNNNQFKHRIYPLKKVNILLSINRTMSPEEAEEVTNLALEFSKKTTPSLTCSIIGLDFSGNPTKNSFSMFSDYFKLSFNAGLTNAIHFAEIFNDEDTNFIIQFLKSNCNTNESNSNAIQKEKTKIESINTVTEINKDVGTTSISNNTNLTRKAITRLGHGCCMKEEHLQSLLQLKHIPMEICLTSNKIAKMVDKMRNHLVMRYIQENFPITLCTDDRGIFSTSMKNEYDYFEKKYNISKEKSLSIQRDSILHIGELDLQIKLSIQSLYLEQFN